MQVRCAAFLLTLLLSGRGLAATQSCDRAIEPTLNSLGYRPRGNRCEGFYKSKVATGSLDLVGILVGRLDFELDAREVIEITSPVVADRTIAIQAQAFPVKTYYRMDAELSRAGRLQWPVDDVLLKKQLSHERISILGWYRTAGSQIFVPLRAWGRLRPPVGDTRVRVYFRPTVDLRNVQYRFVAVDRRSNWEPLLGGRSGRPIVVALPSDLSGLVDVIVSGEVRRAEDVWLEQKVRLDLGNERP